MKTNETGAPVRSLGAYQLKRLTKPRKQIAELCKVSSPAVSQWVGGDTKPGPAAREALALEFGIPVAAWDQPAEAPPMAALPPPEDIPAADGREFVIAARVAQLERSVDRTMADLANEVMTPAERAKVNRECASALASLQKLKNEDPVTLKKIFSSKFWSAIEAAHIRALEPFPEAMRALGKELEAVAEATEPSP